MLAAGVLLALAGGGAEIGSSKDSPGAAKYILFLTADGFRTDYLEFYNPPNLKALAAEGVRVGHVNNVFPTVTTPNMTSLVTGSFPRTTGIACNSQYVPELDRIVKGPRDNKAETIAETLRRAGWKTAAVNHFMLQKRGADFYLHPGYDDAEGTTDAILDLLRTRAVRFAGAIYGATDHAGHRHGPRSQQVKAAVLSIDRAVGRLIQGLKDLGIYEQTLISFNADHGMSAYEPEQVSQEPASALKKAGFKVATSQAELKPDTQIIVLSQGARLVYFRQRLGDEQRAKAVRTLAALQGAEVLDRRRLDELGCHPQRSGDLIVSPRPGFTMSGAGKKGGQHGRFAEGNPVLILRGPGFRQGTTVAEARTVDIVPTLLRLVNVPPAGSVDGKVIVEAFQSPSP